VSTIITGAGGFIGRLLAQRIAESTDAPVTLLDTTFTTKPLETQSNIRYLDGDLCDTDLQKKAFEYGCTKLLHLAAVPGGAAEANPALSEVVNLDATIALFEAAAQAGNCPRIVYTSTIAVLGAPMPEQVNDASPIVPFMTYGTHKAMMELYLADMTRRKLTDSVTVRLPGILARPATASGLKSAFMSDVFHAAKADQPFTSPVSQAATMWLMSVEQCVSNLVHASELDGNKMPSSRVVTLPALRETMGDLVDTVYKHMGLKADAFVQYQPDPGLEAAFGEQPPLTTVAADRAGFKHDGDLMSLVSRAFNNLS